MHGYELRSRNTIQDDDGSIDIGNSNQGSDASFNVRDRIHNGRDAIDVVGAEVLELARSFLSFGTEGILSISIYLYCSLSDRC